MRARTLYILYVCFLFRSLPAVRKTYGATRNIHAGNDVYCNAIIVYIYTTIIYASVVCVCTCGVCVCVCTKKRYGFLVWEKAQGANTPFWTYGAFINIIVAGVCLSSSVQEKLFYAHTYARGSVTGR